MSINSKHIFIPLKIFTDEKEGHQESLNHLGKWRVIKSKIFVRGESLR